MHLNITNNMTAIAQSIVSCLKMETNTQRKPKPQVVHKATRDNHVAAGDYSGWLGGSVRMKWLALQFPRIVRREAMMLLRNRHVTFVVATPSMTAGGRRLLWPLASSLALQYPLSSIQLLVDDVRSAAVDHGYIALARRGMARQLVLREVPPPLRVYGEAAALLVPPLPPHAAGIQKAQQEQSAGQASSSGAGRSRAQEGGSEKGWMASLSPYTIVLGAQTIALGAETLNAIAHLLEPLPSKKGEKAVAPKLFAGSHYHGADDANDGTTSKGLPMPAIFGYRTRPYLAALARGQARQRKDAEMDPEKDARESTPSSSSCPPAPPYQVHYQHPHPDLHTSCGSSGENICRGQARLVGIGDVEVSLVEAHSGCWQDSSSDCDYAFDEYWGADAHIPVTIFGQTSFVPAGAGVGASCKHVYHQYRTTPSAMTAWPPSLLTAFEGLLHTELASAKGCSTNGGSSKFVRKDHLPWTSVRGWNVGLAWRAFGKLAETLLSSEEGGAGVAVPKEWLVGGDFVSLEGHALGVSGDRGAPLSRDTEAAFVEVMPVSDAVDQHFAQELAGEWRALREGRTLGDEVLSECQCRRLLSMASMPLWKDAASIWASKRDADSEAGETTGPSATPALPAGRLMHLIRTCSARLSAS
jgi:hypothetical protein